MRMLQGFLLLGGQPPWSIKTGTGLFQVTDHVHFQMGKVRTPVLQQVAVAPAMALIAGLGAGDHGFTPADVLLVEDVAALAGETRREHWIGLLGDSSPSQTGEQPGLGCVLILVTGAAVLPG